MKGKVVFPLLVAIFLVVAFFASSSHSLGISKEKSQTMLRYGDESMLEKDFVSAKNFYRRAIEFDPYNPQAWKKYETLVQIVTNGKDVDLSGLTFSGNTEKSVNSKSETKKQAEKALEEEGFSFQGC